MYNEQNAQNEGAMNAPMDMSEMSEMGEIGETNETEKPIDVYDERIPKILQKYMRSKNIADFLGEEERDKIAQVICYNTEIDLNSRQERDQIIEEAVKVVKQVSEEKSYPWRGAANAKYPLVLNALVQFNARILPQLIKGDKIVMFDVMRPDPSDEESERAERMANHMSYQLLQQCNKWLVEKDKLLMVYAFAGDAFTKTYRNHIKNTNIVELCLPDEIVVNQGIKELDDAPRITHIMEKDLNYIISRQNSGDFLDIELKELVGYNDENESFNPYKDSKYDKGKERPIAIENYNGKDEKGENEIDYAASHMLYEQHLWIDLDGDGYQEPYLGTVHKDSKKLFNLVARYDETSFLFQEGNEKFIKIDPIQYFTHYRFLPSYNGGFYSMGFAHILAPINDNINSVLNQLLDAGTLSNLQSGFIGNGLRIRKGEMRLEPGEWKQIDAKPGQSIKDNIVPLPTKEPSMVLFQLLDLLIKAGEEISSVSDVMQGQTPAPGTPATTVVNLIQQSMKMFGAILMRLYASLQFEFEKVYNLNKKYMTEDEKYRNAFLSGIIKAGDYQADNYGVFPVADPNLSVDAQSLSKAQTLYQLKEDPNIEAREAAKRLLEALKIPNMQKVLAPEPDPNAPPPPQIQMEMEDKQADIQVKKSNVALNLCKIEEIKEKVHLDETKMILDSYVKGAEIAESKVNSGMKIAETEAAIGEKNFNQAIQTEERILDRTEEITGGIVQNIQPQAQGESQPQGMPQGGQPPQQGAAPQPTPQGEMPQDGMPPMPQEGEQGQGAGQEEQEGQNLGGAIGIGQQPE